MEMVTVGPILSEIDEDESRRIPALADDHSCPRYRPTMPLLYFEYVDIGVVGVVVLIDLPTSLSHKEIQSGPLRWLEGRLFYWQLAGAASSPTPSGNLAMKMNEALLYIDIFTFVIPGSQNYVRW